nr:hypothetical protein [Tanacetum cinerariifolium]
IERLTNELEELKKEKEGLDSKLTGFESAKKDLNTLLQSQRSNKNKEVLGYNDVPPPAQVYSPSKKDMSWTGLPEFADDTITDYKSIMSKPMIKFVKAADSPGVIKTNKTETAMKPPVKYAEMYRNTSKSPKVRGNKRNWNNLMNHRLGSSRSIFWEQHSVENLVPSPSKSEDLSDIECDVPACDDFTTFSNILFDVDDDFSSSDNESFFDEDILKKIYSNP